MNSYSKLKDGSWGVRSDNKNITPGDHRRLTVTKKNGDTEAHDVYCFWSGTDRNRGHIALCRIEDVEPLDDTTKLLIELSHSLALTESRVI